MAPRLLMVQIWPMDTGFMTWLETSTNGAGTGMTTTITPCLPIKIQEAPIQVRMAVVPFVVDRGVG